MSFVFEALPARYGDSLLLTFKDEARTLRLLVDGGPSGVYPTVQRRLDKDRQAAGEPTLVLDAVMVSHIDEDHIFGLIELFSAVQDADQGQQPRPWSPRWLLHNSFDALLDEPEGGVGRALGGETVLAALGGAEGLGQLLDGGELDHTAELVLQSYAQGSQLASLAAALRVTRNPPDGSPIASVDGDPRVLRLGEAALTVVGPRLSELEELREAWAKWQAAQRRKSRGGSAGEDGLQALAAKLDTSVPNLSSLVVVLERGGHKVLLTGDARADYILDGLAAAGQLDDDGQLHVDVLKLPHHGSIRNVTRAFLERVTADHYVASGDGTYGNPDRATLDLIESVRPEGGYAVHLTYPAADCDRVHEAWRARRPTSGRFDPKKDTISPVVRRWRNEGKIEVFEGPVRIEL